MATMRSSLPSRLRQFFSNEGSFGPSLQLESEPPPQIRAVIGKVIQCPLPDITIPLSGFRWEYNKGNFHHWRPLFHHFDTYFKTYLSCRNDLLLSDHALEDDAFPKHAVMQILRVMQLILENCHNKSSFDGLEHFKLLLASTDPEVVIATLETLCALVKIHPSKLHVNGKLIGLGSINSCLLSLAQGWGSKEEGLGLYSCAVKNGKNQEEGLTLFPSDVHDSDEISQYRLGSTLYFELHGVSPQRSGESSAECVTSAVIQMPDLHLCEEDDLLLLKQCLDQYNVPLDNRFSLLTRIRYAHAFGNPRTCRLYIRICLLSFIVLVQSNDANDELVSFFANEPEYTNELIRIIHVEETVSGTIRTLAMLALGAQSAACIASHDRARILSRSNVNFTGGNRTILLNVLQKAILSLNSSSDPSSLAFVEALLQFYLLHVVSTSTSGNIVRGSGMVSTFLPLVEDSDSSHMHLVCYAVKTLQKLMDYSNAALNLFRDLGGVELLAHRLQVEVQRLTGLGVSKSESGIAIAECSRYNNDHLYIQKRLIKMLLKALGSATYANPNASGSFNLHDSSLPSTLALIFGNVDKFGGDIYCSAVTEMSEIIHRDPTCFPALHELGLPYAFLTSVAAGVYPSSKALACIPSGIGAICLNSKGLEAVKEASALRFLVEVFTCRKYIIPMSDAVVPLANAVEELLRHVSSLRGTGVDIIIEIVNKIASLGEGGSLESLEKAKGDAVMDMDSGEGGSDALSSLVCMADSAVEGISAEQYIHLSIFHLMILIHRTTENPEISRLFVEKSGIVALFELLLRPSIIQSSEGMSIALHSTLVFKGFTQQHAAPLASAFCSALREHLKKTLSGFSVVSGSLLDPKSKPDSDIFPSLFLVEFLLVLAASKDSKWLTALLTEFGGDSKDVLEDIGCVHRKILWQIALLEDTKLDVQADVQADTSGSLSEPQQLISITTGTDQQRTSIRQFLDPLLRRRMSGWNVESQYFDLLNLYRDLGRANGTQQQHGSDTSGARYGSDIQLNESASSDADSIARREEEKHRTYYASCCDMVRSLSLHILHMFQELGKVMLVSSRRQEDTLNVSPSSRTVGATFAAIVLEHMNFDGHMSPASEALISSKCRYLGKVVDFIDGILMNRHDSCNQILLNCSFGQGVLHSVLTTFQATSQLLFAIHQSPTSPMDTDNGSLKKDEKDQLEHSWIYGPLSSYGKLMDHLVTSSYILSPSAPLLLVKPISDGHVPFPRNAETFVKVLQSMVLKHVLPVWTQPQFVNCSYDFIRSIISIICHAYSGLEVKNVDNSISATPPNESVISTIVEMGFPRLRAEEALRQVGANSVELAMDWLFLHPEEIPEDDELARALAMSLRKSGSDPNKEGDDNIQPFVEEMIQLPPIDQLLSTCMKLLQAKESLAFPVRDLLMRMCSQDEGQNSSKIVTFIIDQIKSFCSGSDAVKDNALSTLFHVLALMLHEDPTLCDIARKKCLVGLAADVLCQWDLESSDEKKAPFPKWIAAASLAVDKLLQVDKKMNAETIELLRKNMDSIQQNAIIIEEDRQKKAHSEVESSPQQVNLYHQRRLINVACSCIRKQVPAETMHAVLQLCATLTRNHLLAVNFHDNGGLPLLFNLPASCLFSGYDNVAAAIIRHILEDPQTLQQAMESEIKHSFIGANRHYGGRLKPRSFLSNLTSVISRDPIVFMQAALSVCQVEIAGDWPYVVLLKDRDKDRSKEKEKEKDRPFEKEKAQSVDGKAASGGTGVVVGCGKLSESNKNAKSYRKLPNSFVCVIEHLLDLLLAIEPPLRGDTNAVASDIQTVSEMDIDATGNKGKGKAVASTSECTESDHESALMAKGACIVKLLTEILMTYSASVHVLLRKDAEISRCKVQQGSAGYSCGGIFHHILRKFVPHVKNSKKASKVDFNLNYKLATRASRFLVASCIRSSEARKRVFTEVNVVFYEFVKSACGFSCPGRELQAFIDLLNDVLGAHSLAGIPISAEAAGTFIDAGLVRTLTQTLQVLDLDHSETSKLVTGLVKALETVTKEHVANLRKGDVSFKASDCSQREYADAAQLREAASLEQNIYSTAGRTESLAAVQTYGGSEAVTDDMEHDQDLGGFGRSNEDDYMNDTPDDARGLENGVDNVAIRYEIRPDGQDNIVDEDDDDGDDDDEMSENEGEEDEDDEPNGLEEEEEHRLSHPDTDHDGHGIDEDEFDEEVLEDDEEEGEEEEDDEEDGMVLRVEDGIDGTLNVMPVEVFGSRRQSRSMSIYNLLGRSGDNPIPPQHPLLMESHVSQASDNAHDIGVSNRIVDGTSSRLDTVVRYMRTSRQGYRFNLWADGYQASAVSGSSAIPQGLEDLLVSHLRRPVVENPSDHKTVTESENKDDGAPLQESDANIRSEGLVENNVNNQNNYVPAPSCAALDDSNITRNMTGETVVPQVTDALNMQSCPLEIQLEPSDVAVRDIEAVSQESVGSGATLGEGLRSIDVGIASADAHDDGGERPGIADRMHLGELQGTRTRRTSVSFGMSVTGSGREMPHHRLSEIVENPAQETDQGAPTEGQQMNEDASGSIDPAFLDALPEELRAEVLSAQQGQVAQPSNTEQQNTGDIDPEFLAALPPDIRAELLAQQQAQMTHQSQELEGQPVEMDAVSIIATFPSELREEVLLTSSDAVLANLSPALVAEANILRERFAHRYHNRPLFGMYPRSRRGEPSRRVEGSSLDRVGGSTFHKHRGGGRLLDAEGAPLVDSDALKGMIRLLQVFQPIYKGSLQRLLLNLCSHNETRTELVKILMELLMLGTQKSGNQLTTAEPLYRLYACHSHVMYSRPQNNNGVPPMVSRRVLETLTYMARNHPSVAKILIEFNLPQQTQQAIGNLEHRHGKTAVLENDGIEQGQEQEGKLSIAMLLGLLNQPLYLRSIAHLEQLLNLLHVIIDIVESKSRTLDGSGLSVTEPQADPEISVANPDMSTDAAHVDSQHDEAHKIGDSANPSTSGTQGEHDVQNVLNNLPQAEMKLLCSLLAKEGLSDNAYASVAEIMKKLAASTTTHSHLFITELASSVHKLTKLAMEELHVFIEAEKLMLQSTSSSGVSMLRVLQALGSLVASLKEKKMDKQVLPEKKHDAAAALSLLRDINGALEPLWLELSSCISKMESADSDFSSQASSRSNPSTSMPPLPAGTQNILPYIESFFVICEKIHPGQPGANLDFASADVPEVDDASTSVSNQTSDHASKVDEKHSAFVKFSERHRKLLNAFIRQNPRLLEKSFSLMLKVPRFIDFDNKRSHFRSKVKQQHDHHHSSLRISVRRAYILEDSYNQLRMRSTRELKGRLAVHFQGEEGIDAGGLTREWYQLLSKVIFDKGALLFTTVGNDSTFQPNPNSVYQTEHLSYFKFVGRVVGKALLDGQLLDVHFTRSFYKHILDAKVTYHDIEAIDPDFYKNLKWMLENDISDVLDLTFSIDADEEKLILYEKTEVTDYELIPGGRNTKVTEENKHQYVDLIAEHRLTTAIRPQINAFLEGFNELIPRDLISIFNDKELELLISGLPDIDLDDMRANTEYAGYSLGSPLIQWFWEVVQGFSKEEKARLLQFVTGTSKVPLEGFSALQGISGTQKFQIHKAYGSIDHLPSAHTCFNQLDLPEYPSKEHLQERLRLAIHEGNEGFGFG